MAEKPPKAKDVAASTAVGVAQRYGASRQRRGEEVGQGAAVGVMSKRRSTSGRALLWTTLFVIGAVVGVLALMLTAGR